MFGEHAGVAAGLVGEENFEGVGDEAAVTHVATHHQFVEGVNKVEGPRLDHLHHVLFLVANQFLYLLDLASAAFQGLDETASSELFLVDSEVFEGQHIEVQV